MQKEWHTATKPLKKIDGVCNFIFLRIVRHSFVNFSSTYPVKQVMFPVKYKTICFCCLRCQGVEEVTQCLYSVLCLSSTCNFRSLQVEKGILTVYCVLMPKLFCAALPHVPFRSIYAYTVDLSRVIFSQICASIIPWSFLQRSFYKVHLSN